MKLALAACLIATLPAFALAEDTPEEFIGIWATPNCNSATDTLVFFNGFYLWLGEEETTLSGLSLASEAGAESAGEPPDDFIRLEESDGYPNFFQVLPDGRLREAFLPDDAELSAKPDADWASTDYERCGNALPRDKVMLHGEALAVLSVVNEAQSVCSTNQPACATTLFNGVDVTGDGNLSIAEIARLFRVAGYLAAVSEENGASNDDLAAVLATSLPVAPLMASAIVNSFDYDDNGTVSLAELSQDRISAMQGIDPKSGDELGSRLDRMKETLKPLGRILENFGQ